MRTSREIRRLTIPSYIALTPKVLTGAVRKLETSAIEMLIEELMQELDLRCDDPDLEPDADFEEDPDDE